MEVRIASREDFQSLASLRWDFKIEDGERPAGTREEFERRLVRQLEAEATSWTHFLAVDGAEACGMVSVCRVPKLLGPDFKSDAIGYLTNTYVIPRRRAHGAGTVLLNAATKWARENSFELLFVWPSDRSRPLYARCGFRAENEIMELLF